jgi:tetratricopeptide (TPR) repeat protein
MNPSLLILLSGAIYLFGFGALSFLRRQGVSLRFVVEGIVITAAGVALTLASIPVHPLLFLIAIYLITMRVRLLVDLGNAFSDRGRFGQALEIFRLALSLGPDAVSRRIVLINRGVAQLRMRDPGAAYHTLTEALAGEQGQPGAKYLAGGLFNLGLACRRTKREAEAVVNFHKTIDTLPGSVYAQGAAQALKERT